MNSRHFHGHRAARSLMRRQTRGPAERVLILRHATSTVVTRDVRMETSQQTDCCSIPNRPADAEVSVHSSAGLAAPARWTTLLLPRTPQKCPSGRLHVAEHAEAPVREPAATDTHHVHDAVPCGAYVRSSNLDRIGILLQSKKPHPAPNRIRKAMATLSIPVCGE